MKTLQFLLLSVLVFYSLESDCSNVELLPLELTLHIFNFLDTKDILHGVRKINTYFYHSPHPIVIEKIIARDGDLLLFKWIEHIGQEFNGHRYAHKERFFEINSSPFFKTLTTYFLSKQGLFPKHYFQTTELHKTFNKKFALEEIKTNKKFDLLAALARMCKDYFGVPWFYQRDFENEENFQFKDKNWYGWRDFFANYLNKKKAQAEKLFFFLGGISHCIDVDYYEKYEKSTVNFLLKYFFIRAISFPNFEEYLLSRYVSDMENEYKKSAKSFKTNCYYYILSEFLKEKNYLSFKSSQLIIKIVDFLVTQKESKDMLYEFQVSLHNKHPGKYHIIIAQHYLNTLILLKEYDSAFWFINDLKKFHRAYGSLKLNLPKKPRGFVNQLIKFVELLVQLVDTMRDLLLNIFSHINSHNLFYLLLVIFLSYAPHASHNFL